MMLQLMLPRDRLDHCWRGSHTFADAHTDKNLSSTCFRDSLRGSGTAYSPYGLVMGLPLACSRPSQNCQAAVLPKACCISTKSLHQVHDC